MAGLQPSHTIAAQPSEDALDRLRNSVRHRASVFTAAEGGDEYVQACGVFNTGIKKQPSVLVKAHNPSDVCAAVSYASSQGLSISARSGGHGVSGAAVSGQVVVDLRGMKGVRVDKKNKLVCFQTGCNLRDVDIEVANAGLGIVSGTAYPTGAGFFLHGGWGWLTCSKGLACDQIVELDIVTADGKLLTCNKDENADLFWACRGAASTFGIVTSITTQLFEPPALTHGEVMAPIKAFPKLVKTLDSFAQKDPKVGANVIIMMSPPPLGPPQVIFAAHVMYAGPVSETAEMQKAFNAVLEAEGVTPFVNNFSEIDFLSMQKLNDGLMEVLPKEYNACWTSRAAMPNTLQDEDFLKRFGDFLGTIEYLPQDPMQFVVLEWWGHKAREHAGPVDVFRVMDVNMGIFAGVTDPSRCDAQRAAVDRFKASFKDRMLDTTYPNYQMDEEDPATQNAYAKGRLDDLKKQWDPTDMFRCGPMGQGSVRK